MRSKEQENVDKQPVIHMNGNRMTDEATEKSEEASDMRHKDSLCKRNLAKTGSCLEGKQEFQTPEGRRVTSGGRDPGREGGTD